MKILPKNKKIASIWDYDINSIDLSKPEIAKWYLKRRINHCDFKNLEYNLLKKYLSELDIDPVMKQILKDFIKQYEAKNIK